MHPKSRPVEQQNRAIALSYYACGPLAVVPLVAVLALGIIVLSKVMDTDRTLFADTVLCTVCIAIGVILFAVIATGTSAMILLRHTTQSGWFRCATLAAGFPLATIVLGLIFLVLIPAAYLMIALMILSLY